MHGQKKARIQLWEVTAMRKIRLMGAVTAAIGACVLLLTLVSSVSADPPDKVILAVSPSSITARRWMG